MTNLYCAVLSEYKRKKQLVYLYVPFLSVRRCKPVTAELLSVLSRIQLLSCPVQPKQYQYQYQYTNKTQIFSFQLLQLIGYTHRRHYVMYVCAGCLGGSSEVIAFTCMAVGTQANRTQTHTDPWLAGWLAPGGGRRSSWRVSRGGLICCRSDRLLA
ncbi:hypothetical protein GUJ93_ZPchr0039g14226 [Zizania palustris]|uniref:Uncharacterized protein n=1 Tax=Zizania palustris TaxID=103762 RepID=A0A8J5QRS6_ZIZPA|nr:hypothetical protein GUJ93_ZPchr0039g14226 [Zizania palustris]